MTSEGALTLDRLKQLSGGKARADVACPFCGPACRRAANRTRKVMRIWDSGDGLLTYHCERCGESGYARDTTVARTQVAPQRPLAREPERDKAEIARALWARSQDATGTVVETYLRSRGCWLPSPAIRFLAPQGAYEPAMITRFGAGDLTGIHLTRLAADGRGKAGTDTDKVMIGPSKGQALILQDPDASANLIVAEGIEDALSLALAMPGWTVEAAGAAGRIPLIVEAATGFETVVVAHDRDLAGERALYGYTRQDGTVVPGVLTHRPDAVVVDFPRLGDANRFLQARGVAALAELVQWRISRAERRRYRLRDGAFVRRAVMAARRG